MAVDANQPVFPPVTQTPITSEWGRAVSDSVVQKFASVADRDSKWVLPPEGSVSTITGSGILSIYRDDAWHDIVESAACAANIPLQTWWISGGAGTSAANPRILGLANFRKTPNTGLVLGNSNTSFVVEAPGWYHANLTLQMKKTWESWAAILQTRATTPINRWAAHHSRGTWGNPAGVIGFDPNHVVTLSASGMYLCQAGDVFQVAVWSPAGADATAEAGDNDAYSNMTIQKVSGP
jgi:hypothetical protein